MTKKLKDILKNPNDKLIAVDMDGTLCDGEFWNDEGEPKLREGMHDFIWKLYMGGAHIIIYTARQPKWYAFTHGWLVRNQIPFHGIAMTMKPGADLYIDDKALNIHELERL